MNRTARYQVKQILQPVKPSADPTTVGGEQLPAQKYGEDFGRNPVGTGAFVFKEWKQGVSVTLERNPAY